MNQLPATNLAHEIAFDSSASIIDSYGIPVTDSRGHVLWYEVDPKDNFGGFEVGRAVRYLEAVNRLRRHPKFPNRVKVKYS